MLWPDQQYQTDGSLQKANKGHENRIISMVNATIFNQAKLKTTGYTQKQEEQIIVQQKTLQKASAQFWKQIVCTDEIQMNW